MGALGALGFPHGMRSRSIEQTWAGLGAQDLQLLVDRIDQNVLLFGADGECGIESREMLITAARQLRDQRFMTVKQCAQLADPASGFGMLAVSSFIVNQDVPKAVQLAMLAQQVTAAKQRGIDIPNAHPYMPRML